MKARNIIFLAAMAALIFSNAGCSVVKTTFSLEMGDALLRMGDYKRAIAEYEKAKKIDPKSSLSYSRLGLVYSQLGQHSKSMSYYSQAVRVLRNRSAETGKMSKWELSVYITEHAQLKEDLKKAQGFYLKENMTAEAQVIEKLISDLPAPNTPFK
jgi:tetratricopeptide (TPR) repeat protein